MGEVVAIGIATHESSHLLEVMSGDEVLALIISLVISLFTWGKWIVLVGKNGALRDFPRVCRAPFLSAPASALVLFLVLKKFASHDVRDDGTYLFFYVAMGAAATGLAVVVLDALGLSFRDDVVERRNPAACLVYTGVFPGVSLAFAGANIGDGPGWWVVVFSSGLSLGTVLMGWLLVDYIARVGEAIVVGRDAAKGLRMAGWFVAMGAITGRAAAGNWESVQATTGDFFDVAIGAGALIALAAAIEAYAPSRPSTEGGLVSRGVFPALLWIAVAAAYLGWVGIW